MTTHNADGQEFRVCTECEPAHVENCRTCFGFGTYKGTEIEVVPIAAGEARKGLRKEWDRCPECGGTPQGREEEG